MALKVTPKMAEDTLKAVQDQFKVYLGEGADQPKLIDNRDRHFDGRGPDWLIVGEFAYEWALMCVSGEGGAYDDEMSSLAGKACYSTKTDLWPEKVWSEPVNGHQLALYRREEV